MGSLLRTSSRFIKLLHVRVSVNAYMYLLLFWWTLCDMIQNFSFLIGIAVNTVWSFCIFIFERRRYVVRDTLHTILIQSRLWVSLTDENLRGSVKRQYVSCILETRYGSVKLRPFSRRKNVIRTALDYQLIKAFNKWLPYDSLYAAVVFISLRVM